MQHVLELHFQPFGSVEELLDMLSYSTKLSETYGHINQEWAPKSLFASPVQEQLHAEYLQEDLKHSVIYVPAQYEKSQMC
jgi:hypothetical protein